MDYDKRQDAIIEFFVPGKPQGKARARTFYNPHMKRMQSITPDNTVLYENLIKTMFCNAAEKVGFCMTDLPVFEDKVPVRLEVCAMYAVPKSATKKAKAEMLIGKVRPCKKPDMDNIIKCIADALNGAAYKDDTQVCAVDARKIYSVAEEGVMVRVMRIG